MLVVFSIAGLIALLTILDHFMSNNWSGLTSKNRNETVFARRQKDYGAYQLRVDYSRRLLAILLFLGIGIGGMSFASLKFMKTKKVDERKGSTTIICPVFPPKDIEIEKQETEIKEKGTPPKNQFVFLPPKIEDKKIEEELELMDKNGEVVDEKIEGDGDDFRKGDIGNDDEIIETIVKKKTDLDKEHEVVDEIAVYPGGRSAMIDFINSNIRLSSVEGSGKVFVKFLIDKEGKISKVMPLKDARDCFGCLESAIEVIKAMPKWTPAKIDGEPVKAWYSIPIQISDGM
ncbi:MAG: energy transducer TonB [Fluviicola sp.]